MSTSLRGVIVGINKYQDIRYRENPLQFARADAEEMATTLHRSNTLHIAKDDLRLLVNEAATHENVWRSFNEVFSAGKGLEQHTIAFFYFAGHGMVDPIEGDNIILGCCDVDPKNPNKGGIRLNDIYRLVQGTSADCAIAIIDACFSGSIMDFARVDHESPAQLARRAIEMIKGGDKKTIAIFAACSADQKAREDPDVGHGVYTNELLRWLRDGEARDEQGIVDLSGLATYLSRRFAEDYDWQGPRSVVLGGRPVILSTGEPRVPGTSKSPEVLPRVMARLTRIDGRIKLPTEDLSKDKKKRSAVSPQERWKRLLPVVSAIVGTIGLCGLVNWLVEPIRMFSLVVVFLLAMLIPFAGFILHRVFGAILLICQTVLLAGFAYQYFRWGTGSWLQGPLSYLAAIIWVFWIALICELVVLGAMVVLMLMQPSS